MDQLKSKIDQNLLISFYISIGYLFFIFLLYYFFDKEAKPLFLKDTEYKMLYLVDSYENSSEFTKLYDVPFGQSSFYPPVGPQIRIPQNTYRVNITENCYFDSEKNELIYSPNVEYQTFPSNQLLLSPLQLAPRSIEVYRKPSFRAPYVYDFKSNTSAEIPCVGTFALQNLKMTKSPDGMVDFYPGVRVTTEEPSGNWQFPFFGLKQREVTADYVVGDILVNGKFGTAEDLGIVFNPYFTSPGDLWYQVDILGWFK